jgi:hypothetical protein
MPDGSDLREEIARNWWVYAAVGGMAVLSGVEFFRHYTACEADVAAPMAPRRTKAILSNEDHIGAAPLDSKGSDCKVEHDPVAELSQGFRALHENTPLSPSSDALSSRKREHRPPQLPNCASRRKINFAILRCRGQPNVLVVAADSGLNCAKMW